MRLLFLSLLDFNTFDDRNIYTDLLREFKKNGHDVYCISPTERRTGINTHFEENGHLLKLKIGNTQKTNLIEKSISTVLIELQFILAIKKYYADVKFDLVLYSTPPITLVSAVNYIKKHDGAKTYLMLKDIFPQNAVDLGIMSKSGIKGLLYKLFRNKEKKLYEVSDRIGCMSQANVDYLLTHNSEILASKVEICPNCIEVNELSFSEYERVQIRKKYGIPQDKTVFVYGGNLGKPQGIAFIIECLKTQELNESAYFVIIGDGTEYGKLEDYIREEAPGNIKLMRLLPKEDYERMITACDVGMIFLDHRFTIPNFPSRLLSYMQAKIPVLTCTDKCTDIGKTVVEGGFGWQCTSSSKNEFAKAVELAMNSNLKAMGECAFDYLKQNYASENVYQIIKNNIE